MHIPPSITSALKKQPVDNHYFYMHEDMRKSLDRVAEGKDTYASYHYSMLINDLELCLKGFLFAKQEAGLWAEPHPRYLTEDHKLFKLIEQVQKYTVLFPYTSQRDWDELRRFCSNLGRQYTTARYSEEVSFEDFVQLNKEFVIPQIEKIYDALLDKKYTDIEFEPGL